MLGRSITPAVVEAVASIPINNTHNGTGFLHFTGNRLSNSIKASPPIRLYLLIDSRQIYSGTGSKSQA